MKKILRLTESDLVHLVKKVLSEETNGPIKIKLPEQQELLYKYCKSHLLPSNFVNSIDQKINETYKTWVESYIKRVTKDFNNLPKSFKFLFSGFKDDLIKEIEPMLKDVIKKIVLSKYKKIQTYNPNQDIKKIADVNFIRVNKLANNFVLKNMGKALVNKKNVKDLKDSVSEFLGFYETLFSRTEMVAASVIRQIKSEFNETAPVCSNVLVIDDDYEPYNPKEPLQTTDVVKISTQNLFNPYINKIHAYIDSLV